MDFAQLGQHVEKLVTERGLARQVDVDKLINEKAAGVENTLVGFGHLATRLPVLALKYHQEYKEYLDGDKLVDFAAKGKYSDINRAYEDFTSDQRKTRESAEFEAKLKAAREEGEKAGREAAGMSSSGMPTDSGSPVMGHFQQKLSGIKVDADAAMPDAPVGAGVLAAAAARNWDANG